MGDPLWYSDDDLIRDLGFDPRTHNRVEVGWAAFETLWQNTPKKVRIVFNDAEGERHVFLSGANKSDVSKVLLKQGDVVIRIMSAQKGAKHYDVIRTIRVTMRTKRVNVKRGLFTGKFDIEVK